MERQTITGSLSTSGRLSGALSVGGGTTDYNELENKPTYNGHIIEGELTSESLGIWQPKNFSTDEQNTGLKWIDGKDIYFKTYESINSTYNSGVDGLLISNDTPNIDSLINIIGSVTDTSTGAKSSLNGLPAVGWTYGVHINPNGYLILWASNFTNVSSISGKCKILCTIFYTKN